jgi:hypothetical protein
MQFLTPTEYAKLVGTSRQAVLDRMERGTLGWTWRHVKIRKRVIPVDDDGVSIASTHRKTTAICSIKGCNKPHIARGRCVKHYRELPEPKLKREARVAVSSALVTGKLTRGPCESDGCEAKAEAHHDSYEPDQWLKVRWFCKKHHAAHHKLLRNAS